MSSLLTRQEEELTCPVCHDIFRHPVLLSCSHSFCKACLERWWTSKPTMECPICSKRSSRDQPTTNLVVRNLCENLLQEEDNPYQNVASLQTSDLRCSAHVAENPSFFCLDDERPACLACRRRSSEQHDDRNVLPVNDEALVARRKRNVQESLQPLKEKLAAVDRAKANHDQAGRHVAAQARGVETRLREQFEKLHGFLREQEEARLSALREEEQQKSQELKKKIQQLNQDAAYLSDAIRAAEDQLRADEHVSFLQSYKTTMERVRLTTQAAVEKDPLPLWGGALIDEAKHLGNLAFRVWYEMKDVVSYTPVILDPNTAWPGLVLSDDLTSVRYDGGDARRQQLPDNAERFDVYARVLGSQGFTSGTHSWDVEVGHNRHWSLGVLAESFQRKGKAGSGYCMLYFSDGRYRAFSSAESPTATDSGAGLSVRRIPRRIRVHLDWEGGRLSFSDPDDSDGDAHLHTFTHTFDEALFPYVYCGRSGGGEPLRVLPRNICASVQNDS